MLNRVNASDRSPIQEPYNYLSGRFHGNNVTVSPDALVNYRWNDPRAIDDLEIFIKKPISFYSTYVFEGLDSVTTDSTKVTISSSGRITLDFGAEFAGWFEFDSPNLSGSITLGISEYNQPEFVNTGPQSPSKTAKPVKYNNTYRLELNSELYEGVRFGFINIDCFHMPFTITGVRLVCQTKPVNYNGSFDCSNDTLNKIWYTAAYDVRLNLKKDYISAILIDRGDRHSWTGDAYPAQAASIIAFANYDFILHNLKYTSTHKNGIESYELYWVFSLIDYYNYTGDKLGVSSLLNQAISRLDHAYSIYDKNPELIFFGWDERLGAGFENPNIEENYNSYKMLAIEAWKKFSIVLRELGEKDTANKYSIYADQKSEEINVDSNWYKSLGIHAFSDAINAGIIDNTAVNETAENFYNNRLNRLSYSPFNQYFILKAMGKSGNYDHAISSILDLWGGQIGYGGTTFFETFRPQWNEVIKKNAPVPNNQAGYTSLCHPWSAGVLNWMNEELLGIKPTSAGFATFSVTPHMGSQLTYVRGKTPTPNGNIEVSFNINNGKCSVTIPHGLIAIVGIPKAGKNITGILMNGETVHVVSEDENFKYISGLINGTYHFMVTYNGISSVYKPNNYVYSAKVFKENLKDNSTEEICNGKYGADGYVVCNNDGSDIMVLPDYISSVKISKAKSINWGACFNSNKIGAYSTQDNIACHQTFTVDICLEKDRIYTVALYFVDFDKINRQSAVEMFDFNSLNLIAPIKVLNDYTNGTYLVYTYNKSARFRINQIRGINAVLNGIFFGCRIDKIIPDGIKGNFAL